MASRFIWMDSTLQDLSNGTQNIKFGVRTKKLCKLQSMKLFNVAKALVHRGEPEEQQTKMLRVCCSEQPLHCNEGVFHGEVEEKFV